MPGFVFSVGISPALAAGSLEALHQLRTHPEIIASLHAAIRAFAESAKRRRLDICLAGETAVLPVLVGKDEDAWLLSNELKKRGVSVPPAMYPAVPKGKARLRFCVISEHKPEQIERALDILEATAREFGIELPRRNYD
jgi:7-keto-8-aminopelargonate synthetase-like enzyme